MMDGKKSKWMMDGKKSKWMIGKSKGMTLFTCHAERQ
jgi:hypothetical protein